MILESIFFAEWRKIRIKPFLSKVGDA